MNSSGDYFGRVSSVMDELTADPPSELDEFSEAILTAWENGGKVVSFGNGGSAADSMHFTTELVARFDSESIHKPAISLACNASTLTAIANDWSFEEVFARQVRAQVDPEDVVLGISTSGDSKNVIEGLKAAHERGAGTFGLTGNTASKFDTLPIVRISVPSSITSHIQEAHIVCLHYVCDLIDQTLNK